MSRSLKEVRHKLRLETPTVYSDYKLEHHPDRSTERRVSRMSVVAIAFSASLASGSALAAEGAFYGGPQGGTDIRNAYTPPRTGFYGVSVGLYAEAQDLHGDTGSVLPLHARTDIGVAAAGILYVYPFQIYGGALDSFVQQGGTFGYGKIGTREGTATGVSDTYVELLGWSRYIGPLFGEGESATQTRPGKPRLPYGLTVKVAYSMIFPDGNYKSSYLFPSGHDDIFFIPNIAATYLTQPNLIGDGLEFSGHVFGDFANINPTTHYSTGTVVDVDFALSDRLGRFQFGLAGFYAQQVERDRVGGRTVAPNGDRLLTLDLGPVLAYDIPAWRSTFKIKYQAPVVYQDTLGVQRIILSYAFKF